MGSISCAAQLPRPGKVRPDTVAVKSYICRGQDWRLQAIFHWTPKLHRKEVSLRSVLCTGARLLTLGYRLAYAEMRLIIARLVWEFDIELRDKQKNWTDQEVYWSWKKPALMVQLHERALAK